MTARVEPSTPDQPLASRFVHSGRVVHLSVDTVRFPDGSTGELELIRHSGAAAVLPVLGSPDEDDPEVLLVRQFRYATGGYIYEVPAGRPDRVGEAWEVCAARELEEETGLVAGSLEHLTAIHTTPGFTDELIHLYIARNLRAGSLRRDVDEFIELVELRLSKVLEMIRTGEITDGKTICAVLYVSSFLVGSKPRE